MGDFVIGVDGGGTRTRALILDSHGVELGEAEGEGALIDPRDPDAAVEAIVGAVSAAAHAAHVEPPAAALCAGLAGGGRDPERTQVEAKLRRRAVARIVRVVTDAETAFFDAFGDGPGILVIAGTGSVAWGRNERGETARAGGWGALLGDEGSAYDLARRALRAAARAADGRAPDTALCERLLQRLGLDAPEALIPWAAHASKADIAAVAPAVLETAQDGDEVAAAIVEDAVTALADHVAALLRRLGPWDEPPPVATAGALLEPGAPLHAPFAAAIRHYRCRVHCAPLRGVRGAARLALRHAQLPD